MNLEDNLLFGRVYGNTEDLLDNIKKSIGDKQPHDFLICTREHEELFGKKTTIQVTITLYAKETT